MADLLDFHKREQAVDTYEFINLLSMEHEELYDSPSALAGLKFVREIETSTTKSKKWGFKAIRQYKFDPAQITKIGLGSSLSSSSIWPPRLDTEDNGPTGEIKIVDIDLDNGTIDLDVRGATEDIAHPESVFEREYFSKKQFEEALQELAKLVPRPFITSTTHTS